MYTYTGKNFDLYNINIIEDKFILSKNELPLIQGNIKPLKEINCLLELHEFKNTYIFSDYYKGVKIYKNNIEYFYKFTSVYKIATMNNYIIFMAQKKLYIMNIDTLEILKEMNRSENFYFSESNNYALFYRLKNNKSYLVDSVNNTTVYLKNFIKDNVIIHKICIKNDSLYVLVSEKSILKVIKYNLISLTTEIIDVLGKGSANGVHYYQCFEMIVKDENLIVNKETINYLEYICYVFKKYGLFVALYSIDNKKLDEYKDTKYNVIIDSFQNLIIKLNRSKNIVDSNDKLENLKIEITKSENIIEKEIDKLIKF